MSTSDEKQNWPPQKTYLTTVLDYPIQRVHKVLRDLNQWDKWHSQYKNIEMLTPPPFDQIGARRVLMTEDKRVRVWQELVGIDDSCFSLVLSVLPYRKETEKYRAEGIKGSNERSEIWIHPVTLDGNFGSVVECSVSVNTEHSLEEVEKAHLFSCIRLRTKIILVNQSLYSILFKDLEAHLEKSSTKELNSFYLVKYLEEGKVQLFINLGALLPESSGSLFSKIKSFLTSSKVNIIQEDHTRPERENSEPSGFSVTYSETHEAKISVHPVTIAGTGQAKRLMKGPTTTYIQAKHKLVVSVEAIEDSVTVVQKQFQELITTLK